MRCCPRRQKKACPVWVSPGRYLPSPLPAALAEKADRLGLSLPNCRPICALPSWPMRCPARSHGGEYRRSRSGSVAVLLHHLISGAPLSEAMERQAAESGIHLECPHILLRIRAMRWNCSGASGCTRQKSAAGRWARTCGAHCRRMAFAGAGGGRPVRAGDTAAAVMADFAADHGVIWGVSRPYGGTVGFQKADRSARCGAPHGGANGNTLRDRRPSGVVRLLGGILPGGNGHPISIGSWERSCGSQSRGGLEHWTRWRAGFAV